MQPGYSVVLHRDTGFTDGASEGSAERFLPSLTKIPYNVFNSFRSKNSELVELNRVHATKGKSARTRKHRPGTYVFKNSSDYEICAGRAFSKSKNIQFQESHYYTGRCQSAIRLFFDHNLEMSCISMFVAPRNQPRR